MPDSTNKARVGLLICLLLAVVTLAVYWPATHCEFVNYDDTDYVTQNLHVRTGLTWDNVRWAATARYAGNWHPLTWISHMLDCELYGPKPAGHHVTNLVLHMANSVLVFLILQRMTGAQWRSAFVAALFALHPLHVESVAWVAERKDVLSTFFWAVTIWAYVRYAQTTDDRGQKTEDRGQRTEDRGQTSDLRPPTSDLRPPTSDLRLPTSDLRLPTSDLRPPTSDLRPLTSGSYWLAMLFFALGLLAKPMLVTLPFLLLLLDFWPLRRMPPTLRFFDRQISLADESAEKPAAPVTMSRLLLEKLPLLALSGLCSVMTFWAQGTAVGGLRLPFLIRLENALLSYARYIEKMIWPTRLVVLYPFSPDFATWHLVAAIIAVCCVTYLAIRYARACPYLFTGWFWYVGVLAPVIGLVQVGLQSMADRYTYVPLIGLFIIMAWGGYDLARHWQLRPAAVAVLAMLPILACIPVTRAQVAHWQNSYALFNHALRWTANNYTAENNLALALLDRGHIDAARRHLAEALRIRPDYADALGNMGLVVGMQGNADAEIAFYRAAAGKQPAVPEFHHNLACALAKRGEWDEAIKEFEVTLRLDPDLPQPRADLARALSIQGRLGEARAQWAALLQRDPDNADAHMGLGLLQAADKDFPAALGHLNEAVRLRSNDAEIRLRVGDVLAEAGRTGEACRQFSEAIRINPTNAMIHAHVALALERLAQIREAVAQYQQALRLDAGMPVVLNNLAWILASNPDPQIRNGAEAVRLAEQACALTRYQEATLVSTLGAAYAEAGRFEQAVEMARKAEVLAASAGNQAFAQRNKKMAELFLARQPCRESSGPATNPPSATP
jgi:Flp pilus assembly protein TadD